MNQERWSRNETISLVDALPCTVSVCRGRAVRRVCVLSLRNRGGISYETGDATFVVECRKKGKRSVQFERNLYPLEKSGSLSAPPGDTSRIVYRFDKTNITKVQVLKVYLYETGGQRNLVLAFSYRDINKARRE